MTMLHPERKTCTSASFNQSQLNDLNIVFFLVSLALPDDVSDIDG